ncbi:MULTISPECIES: OprD family porin [Pseudomonas syringae group]|uniref:OprD family porin n=1 Tax=Pseudomonas syringae group TaxID=136849 RepID=UPI000401EF0E|nr:OprD family porin [Pseudomonas viridiflava]MBD8568308.1 OprD family porin [Pseudomonas syringae]MCF9016824.1 outer membrane porin, OprD family [Pseudomonas syringae]MCJ8175869.1 OprD family porin [Pseudomonas viridiflava]MEE3927802.1 OprD family porin [Pseudomonas viridiflava]MEE3931801.1 OprD family porin [Pseudomonas viridiflava]
MKTTSTALLALSLSSFGAMVQAEPASQTFVPTELSTKNAQAEANGFFEDQHLTGTTRNWYANELRRRDSTFGYTDDGVRKQTPRRINWQQGTIVNYTSGYTQGTVGFSTELALYNAIALDRDTGDFAGNSNRTLADSDGDAVGQWSKMGLGNVKARVSNTVLTMGRQSVNTPVIAFIGNRALPSSFQGFAVQSDEFNNLSLQAGSFDRVSPRMEQSLDKFRSEYGDRSKTADRLDMFGGDYKPTDSLTASFYASNLEDFWHQYYFGFTHELGDSKVFALSSNLNYYKTKDAGQSKLGAIDNDTYSLSFTGTHEAHSVSIAYQEVAGNEYFDYAHDTNAIFLANSLLSDFNGPNEKSLQIAYVLNMASYGVPGLKFNIYQARGWDIDGTHYKGTGYTDVLAMDGETHYEYGIGTSYSVQSGPLKATAIRATYTTHRASENQADGNINEFRLVTTIPFNIL